MGKRKRKSSPNVGKEELAVFRFVQQNAPATVREVSDHFADQGKARTTILTVMERLREKGLLQRQKSAGAFKYEPTKESSSIVDSLIGSFFSDVLGGSLAPFMAYMSDSVELSSEEIQELKEMVGQLEKETEIG